jgi:hypothetical protein
MLQASFVQGGDVAGSATCSSQQWVDSQRLQVQLHSSLSDESNELKIPIPARFRYGRITRFLGWTEKVCVLFVEDAPPSVLLKPSSAELT